MPDYSIKIENLGKKYIIGHETQAGYKTLRDAIVEKARNAAGIIMHPFSNKNGGGETEEFWALKGIDLEIKTGDRVGIIGRNGAGKSTLLKILSRITDPTTGDIWINGRVASLLEVGTGFHPELTGRENIFLNGAVLGMGQSEIKRKFDEIVAFSEVEKFLDTPVKRYSSGMYVRLAFAVAAHLEPEILIIDEVLAVGDAAFQKKCLGKMEEVGKDGRTVLFVSHNMNAIEQLCRSCVLLEKGEMKSFSTDVNSVIKRYLGMGGGAAGSASKWVNGGAEYENEWFRPSRFFICDGGANEAEMPVSNNKDVYVQIEGEIRSGDIALQVGIGVYGEDSTLLYWSFFNDVEQAKWPALESGKAVFRYKLPQRLLNEGVYRIELLSSLYFRAWICEPYRAPSIILTIQGGLSDSPYWMVKRPGLLAPVGEWSYLKD
jgi:lipopolysaccharide transport system ATP-binding protein